MRIFHSHVFFFYSSSTTLRWNVKSSPKPERSAIKVQKFYFSSPFLFFPNLPPLFLHSTSRKGTPQCCRCCHAHGETLSSFFFFVCQFSISLTHISFPPPSWKTRTTAKTHHLPPAVFLLLQTSCHRHHHQQRTKCRRSQQLHPLHHVHTNNNNSSSSSNNTKIIKTLKTLKTLNSVYHFSARRICCSRRQLLRRRLSLPSTRPLRRFSLQRRMSMLICC